MATAATIQGWINEAEAARHALMVGNQAIETTSPNGVHARFKDWTIEQMQQYIDRLKTDLQVAVSGNRRPVYFSFGR